MHNQPQIIIARDFEFFFLKESYQIICSSCAIQITNELTLMDVTLAGPIRPEIRHQDYVPLIDFTEAIIKELPQ